MLEALGLTQYYGARAAIQDVSIAVGDSEAVGFLGPNGAGKTTTLRILAGFLAPSAGTVRIAGFDLATQPLEAKRRLGYLPENNPLYRDMRAREFLRYRARLKGLGRREAHAAADRVLARCGVMDAAQRILGQLSKGYRQRVGIADGLLGDPPLLLLDEPTVGLDPNQVAEVRSLICEISRERSILLSSHILHEVELLCRRVIIIQNGRVLAEGEPHALAERCAAERELVLRVETEADPREALGRLPGVLAVRLLERTAEGALEVSLRCAGGADPRRAAAALALEKGWLVPEMRLEPVRLEDVFARLTRGPEVRA